MSDDDRKDEAAAKRGDEPVCTACQGTGLNPSRTRFCSACLGSGKKVERPFGWQ